MYTTLNAGQAKELARFFFDVAKGLVLGGVGFATVSPFEVKIITVSSSFILSYFLVKFALSLLEETK